MDEKCPNCKAPGVREYCPSCGQKVPTPEDLHIRHFVADVFESFTSLEGRFGRTIWTLFRWPGQLTLDFLEGRRQRYLKPVQLFVVCNVIYFLSLGFVQRNTFTTPVNVQLSGQLFSPIAKQVWRWANPSDPDTFAKNLNAVMTDQARTLVFMLVPIFAFWVWILMFRRRRLYVENLVYATHIYSLALLLLPLFSVLASIQNVFHGDLLIVVTFLLYFFFAARVAYGLSIIKAIISALAQVLAFAVTVAFIDCCFSSLQLCIYAWVDDWRSSALEF